MGLRHLLKQMTQVNRNENSVVAVYPLHSEGENAINLLKEGDFWNGER